jgi:hypothetical protein
LRLGAVTFPDGDLITMETGTSPAFEKRDAAIV